MAAKETHINGWLSSILDSWEDNPLVSVPGTRRWGEQGVRKTRVVQHPWEHCMPRFSQEQCLFILFDKHLYHVHSGPGTVL